MTILCYHAVEPGWQSPLAITPEAFDRQCAWLSDHRSVLPLAEAVGRLDASGRLPRGTTALTFDDGFAGLYEHALPVLRKYGLPATVFLVAQTLTPGGREVDWVDTPPDWPLRTLTREQVLRMRDAGVRFASHSYAHADLTALARPALATDLTSSREVLEDLLGEPVPFLAYPRGRHNDAVRAAAVGAGYTHAFALPESREEPAAAAVPRVGIYPGNGTRAMRLKTMRGYLPVRTGRAYPLLRRLTGRGAPPTRRVG